MTNIFHPTLAAFALAALAFAPTMNAVNPPPDGAYPGLNTAEGQSALLSLDTSTGLANTAVGWFSLKSDVNGTFNTAIGAGTLVLNVGDPNTGDGTENTAVGAAALLFNTTGSGNTANGAFALFSNTAGISNTAAGANALHNNTIGEDNAALGADALSQNTTGNWNVAAGDLALSGNTTGAANTAVGNIALVSNGTGAGNAAFGAGALRSNTAGFDNIGIGENAGCLLTSGNNNTYIGNFGVDTESNTIRIGRVVEQMNCDGFTIPANTTTYIAGIYGATASGGTAVYINSDGNLGTLTSSARFKTDINPMERTSEAILALKPVTFRYKREIDRKRIPQFGLVAEDVAKVNPDLVVRDKEGKPYTVRYDAVNAMLLNEFLKEHRKVEALQAGFARQEKDFQTTVSQQQKQIEALTAGLQKVSAQLEASKPAPQVVNNP